MTTESDQLRIARAIAYEIECTTGDPGWATESMQPEGPPDCPAEAECTVCGPRPLTTLAAALEAWVASGGDPERGPCLRAVGDRITWAVDRGAAGPVVRVCVGRFCATRHYGWTEWRVETVGEHGGIDALEFLGRIIRAVETEVGR